MADNATVLRLNEVDSEDVSSSGKFMPPVFRPGFSIGNLPSRHPQLSRLETMPHCKILWPSPPPQLSLEQSAPHVWAARLDVPAAARANFASTLSPLETERAARFHFARHRDRFIAARGLLRSLLGHYLQIVPSKIEFDYGPNGKPLLPGAFAKEQLHFNLTHSEDLALIAVARGEPVGVDVERIRTLSDADELVSRFFSVRENASFQKLPESQRPAAFFNLWTRKEAWLKATGEGIGHLLNRVEVSFLPGEPASLLSLPGELYVNAPWTLQDLAPAPGFAAALAFPGPQRSICTFQFRPETSASLRGEGGASRA